MKNTWIKCITALVCSLALCVTGVLCSQKLANSEIEAAENRPAAAAAPAVSDAAVPDGDEEVHTDGSAATQYDVPVNAAPAAEETPAQADTAAVQKAAPAAASSSSESKQTSSKPQTTAQVLAYFNTAVNKVKPGAKSLV